MLQTRGRTNLGAKALAAQRRAEIGVQHFDRDIAIVFDVVREVHGGHAAGAELAIEAVAAAKGGGEAIVDGQGAQGG